MTGKKLFSSGRGERNLRFFFLLSQLKQQINIRLGQTNDSDKILLKCGFRC